MKKLFFTAIVITLSASAAVSQDCFWKGTADSLWQNPLNWSCQQVPDSSHDVYIFGGTPFSPVVTSQVSCKNLFLIDSIIQYLDRAYAALAGDWGYGSRFSLYYTVDNDELMFSPTAGVSNINDRRSLARYSATAENTELEWPFEQLYTGIERTNLCIQYLSKALSYAGGTDSTQRKKMYGEALTLRAQLYFELIRNWGDVPYTESSSFLDPFSGLTNMQHSNRDSTYQKILNDLSLAATYLPWRSELLQAGNTPDERITKGAAKALRARIALFAGGYSLRSNGSMQRSADHLNFYQLARQECLDLMNNRNEHTLNPDYKYLWKNTICAHQVEDGYGEFIWQLKMEGGQFVNDSKLGFYNGPKGNNFGNASLALLPSYFYLFDSIDTRRDVTAAPYDIIADSITKRAVRLHEIRDGKFRRDWISNPSIDPGSNGQYFGLNWPMIRFADVLLMFAEADNEINNGPTAAGIEAFEEVRRRAYGSNAGSMGATPVDKTGFFNTIVKERALELGAEGIRKFDLIRWNLLETKILETRESVHKMLYRQPPYSTLPIYMYYYTGSTADDGSIWYNSLYHEGPVTSMTIPGASRIGWINSTTSSDPLTFPLNTGTLAYFANGFIPNKCELVPYPRNILLLNPALVQNPGY